MGIFNRLFSSSEPSSNPKPVLDWIPLSSVSQLDEIESQSDGRKAMIFKHSTRCGISRMVLRKFEAILDLDENSTLYFLDLLNHRDISNEIANRFQVTHQSPQLLVIENGNCTDHASHHQIVELVSN